MNRTLLCVVAALAFAFWRANSLPSPGPNEPTPAVAPAGSLVAIAQTMDRQDRTNMAEAYQILARAVAADPQDEPVFDSTQAVRLAHRAAMLAVWRGVLGNKPDKYPGLGEKLEGVLEQRIGKDDVPLNPTIRQESVRAFQEIAAAFSR